MKNFQQNLLILLALALCGLCVFQWHEQTAQRNEISTLNGLVYDKNVAIRDATNSIAVLNHQVEQMDARLTEIKAGAATNEQVVASQKAEMNQLQFANHNLTSEVSQYKTAVETLESRLKQAYADLEKQNEVVTNLVAQRDDLVGKLNHETQDRNDIVAKYNELAKQIQTQETGGAAKP